MGKIRASYFVVVAIATILNGWALVHSLSVAPEHAGIIAAVLLTNMLSIPIIVWAAFVFGEVAGGFRLKTRRQATRSMRSTPQDLHDRAERKEPTWAAGFC